MDIIDAAYKLQGLVSTRTLLEQIPFVNDVDLEIEELAKEKRQRRPPLLHIMKPRKILTRPNNGILAGTSAGKPGAA